MQPTVRIILIKVLLSIFVALLLVIGLAYFYSTWSREHYQEKITQLDLPIPLKPPLAEDTAFAELSELGHRIDLSDDDKDVISACTFDYSKERDQGCLQLLQRDDFTDVARALDQWLAGSAPYKLSVEGEKLAGHARINAPLDWQAPFPDLKPIVHLIELTRLQANVALIEGKKEEALNRLTTFFSLTALLRDSGTLMGLMSAVHYDEAAMMLMIARMPGNHAEAAAAILPERQAIVAAAKLSIGHEAASASQLFGDRDQIFAKATKPQRETFFDQLQNIWLFKSRLILYLFSMLPIYSIDHTNLLSATYFAGLIDAIEQRKTGTNLTKAIKADYWSNGGFIRFVHNPIGRILAEIYNPAFNKYLAQIGRHLDRLEATKITLAAKRFFLKHDRWPTAFDQLIPGYVAKIPVSYLNNKVFMPIDDRQGITLYDLDGEKPATGREDNYGWLSTDCCRH